MPDFFMGENQNQKNNKHELKNGILYLKGGDLTRKDFPKATEYNLADFLKMNF
jgi:16S rRNA (guanine527-N7)-methyltransferase